MNRTHYTYFSDADVRSLATRVGHGADGYGMYPQELVKRAAKKYLSNLRTRSVSRRRSKSKRRVTHRRRSI